MCWDFPRLQAALTNPHCFCPAQTANMFCPIIAPKSKPCFQMRSLPKSPMPAIGCTQNNRVPLNKRCVCFLTIPPRNKTPVPIYQILGNDPRIFHPCVVLTFSMTAIFLDPKTAVLRVFDRGGSRLHRPPTGYIYTSAHSISPDRCSGKRARLFRPKQHPQKGKSDLLRRPLKNVSCTCSLCFVC